MSHSTETAKIVISNDEILDLLVNGVESIVTLNVDTRATLRNVTDHSITLRPDGSANHTFRSILTIGDIYEHDAEIVLVGNMSNFEFVGSATFKRHFGGNMAE